MHFFVFCIKSFYYCVCVCCREVNKMKKRESQKKRPMVEGGGVWKP